MGHSEEGGPYGGKNPAVPTWAQLPGFFSNWPAIVGFAGYAYYGNPEYNMFDGPGANATELPDGKQFFSQLANIGEAPDAKDQTANTPACSATLSWKGGEMVPLAQVDTIKAYDTGENTYPKNCPKPLQASQVEKVVV